MLFNSYEFIFVFLPLVALGFFFLVRKQQLRAATAWLVSASLIFYGWWNPIYLWLILFSLLFNYALGASLMGKISGHAKRSLLWMGIGCNLGLLGYFKYANFFIENFSVVTGVGFQVDNIILPLAISFFTFQQVAYLVDAYQGKAHERDFLRYALFVTFFPQLIAGPIVHHKEMMPQFGRWRSKSKRIEDIAVGLTIFSLGLFKKVVLADGVAPYANLAFDNAALGYEPSFTQAWIGAIAYAFQLYFDFSAYSDMAVGAARIFGITLPINFFSPYKSTNIIEFWRRWHITLSRFLRDYLYIPLGGNRKGKGRRYVNLLITMLLGGLWHGAGWTFIFWGLLHGIYLVINHAWHAARKTLGHDLSRSTLLGRLFARGITFMAVLVAWVFFRAADFDSALLVLTSMSGLSSYGFWIGDLNQNAVLWLLALAAIIWFLPNTYTFMKHYAPVLNLEKFQEQAVIRFVWLPAVRWGIVLWGGALVAILHLSGVSEFLYFNF